MKLNVTNPDGSVEVLEVPADTTGQQLKEKCRVVIEQNELQAAGTAANVNDDEGSSVDPVPNKSLQYKLICVGLGKVIVDECRIGEQGLKDADKLLLLNQRAAPIPKPEKRVNRNPIVEEAKPEDLQTDAESAPTQDAIDAVTRNITKRNLEKKAWMEKGPSSTMTPELARLRGRLAYRQGFITLIEIAHKLLCTDPKAASAVKEALANARMAAKEKARIPMVDPGALKHLLDMGFPEIASRKALAANKMQVEPAMEWLLTHSNDKDYNDPLPRDPTDEPIGADGDNNNSTQQTNTTLNTSIPSATEIHTPSEGATHSTNSGTGAGAGAGTGSGTGAGTGTNTESSGTSDGPSAHSSEEAESLSPEEVLSLFREFRNRPRKAPPELALHFLQTMGFTKEEAIEALAVNNNNHKTACEWLLGGKKPRLDELDRPLDEQSKLHQEFVKNPVILMGLTKVRTLLALEHLTHCPEALEFWLNDLEVGQVLSELNQIISMDFDFEDDPTIEVAVEALDLLEDEDDDDDD